MANHKSAAKRARQSVKRNTVNSKTLSTVRSAEKKLRKALAGKDKKASTEALTAFESSMMKAAQKGRVPFRTASRKIGRVSKAVAAL